MSNITCYSPTDVDKAIAEQIPQWNSHTVANLRGLYEEVNGKSTTDIKELINFRKQLSKEDAKKLSDVISDPLIAYDQLRLAFSAQERIDRVNMIANKFSDVVNAIQEKYPTLSREDIIKGFTDQSGKFQGGIPFIYEMVRRSLIADANEMVELANKTNDPKYIEAVNKYRQVFKNFAALMVYANTVIRETEGYKIGVKLNFATETNFSDYNDSLNIESFSVEESTKEKWQEMADSISPFGCISVHVRRMLGRLSKYSTTDEKQYDDLGYLRRIPAVKVHQTLMEILRGVQDENDMEEMLRKEQDNNPYIKEILEEFRKNPILRTQFFIDFSKSFQLYSMQEEINKGGILTFRQTILNTLSRKSAYKRYLSNLNTKSLNDKAAIFTYAKTGTVINKARCKEISEKIKAVLGDEDSESIFSGEIYNPDFTWDTRIEFYKDVLSAFGIYLTDHEYSSLYRNKKAAYNLDNIIKELPAMLDKATDGTDVQDFLNRKLGKNADEGYLKEKLGKIFQITESLDANKSVLSRVRYHNNTYYSDVQSSYLGRFMDFISRVVKGNEQSKLADYILKKYGDNPFFFEKEGNKVKCRNKWLHELMYGKMKDFKDSNGNMHKSFSRMFTYSKLLGDKTQDFEDFTTLKQGVNMISRYFSEGKSYAWYPVFILGDSGASKWIRAKRYSEEEIVDGLYEVFLQEKDLQRHIKELKNGLEKEGKSLGSLSKISDGKFGLLPFLNDPKYSSMIDPANIEESVKNAIRKHLEDAFEAYMNKIKEAGILDRTQKGQGEYKYLSNLSKPVKIDSETELKGEDAIRHNLKDYFYNTKFATIMQMEIMTVSPIFYKNGDSTDLQKRYKGMHASGNRISTSGVDPFNNNRPWVNRTHQTTVYFDDVEVNTEETNSKFMEVIEKVYGGKDSDVYKAFKEVSLTDGQGYRTLTSYRAVMGMAGKWNQQCENAYNEIEQIRKEIRDQGGEINDDQADRLYKLMVVFQPIKPLVQTLESVSVTDEITGEKYNFQIPVQLKYAETVMIPELMPKGSKLRNMLEWAEKNDVDVLAATTAVKVGSFGSVNVKDATNKEELDKVLSNASVHKLSYDDYIIQNNVPEHINGSQLFATQTRKLIFANLKYTNDKNSNIYYDGYVEGGMVNNGNGMVRLNAYNLNRFYVSLIATNILEDFDEFSTIIDDPEKVRQVLVQMTINNSRESKDNLRGYGKGIESDFKLALFEGGVEHDTAALLLSIFKKKVNKQKILGGSAVQVSAFGITGYSEDNNLQFVKDPNNDANILYAQCEMPFDLSYTDNNGNVVQLNFSDWCKADGTLKTDSDGNTLIEKKFPGILDIIAYRIPTEEKYSMLNLKVVRFTQKVNGGGTIKVPAQGTKLAGFDFDIDKLYFMRREYKFKSNLTDEQISDIWKHIYAENPHIKEALLNARSESENILKLVSNLFSSFYNSSLAQDIAKTSEAKDRLYKYWEQAGLEGSPKEVFNKYLEQHSSEYLELDKYDPTKPAWDESQSRVARNNMLMNLIQKRLEDPQTIKERTTPGGFEHAKEAANYIKKLLGIDKIEYDYSDPWTMVVYNQQNQIADKLIGIFANQNTNHAMASLMSVFELTTPIAFGEHRYGLNNLLNPDALTKELLAAAVDAVKEPVLNFLNLNTITADSAALLCRLGYNFKEIGLLMNQPIIKYLCEYCMSNNMSDIDTAINNVLSEWGAKGDYAEQPTTDITINFLEEGITRYKDNSEQARKSSDFVYKQAMALELFRKVYASAKEVSNFVTNTKFTASNAVKSTFGGMYAQQAKVNRYVKELQSSPNPRIKIKVGDEISTPISTGLNMNKDNREKYIMSILNSPFGYEQVMYDSNVAATKKMCRYYPYETPTYVVVRGFIDGLTKSGLDEATIDDIHKHLLVYAIGLSETSRFNPSYQIKLDNGEQVDAKEYYTKYVPIKVMNLLQEHPELKELPIFAQLISEVDNDGNTIIKLMDAGALTPTQKEEIRDSWEVLLDNPELRKVAMDLYMYSYYKDGFGFGVVGFNHLAPLELKLQLEVDEDTTYEKFLNSVLDGVNLSVGPFTKDFIKTHRDNKKLVYEVKAKQQYNYLVDKVYQNGIPVDSFELDYSTGDSKVKPFILRNTKEEVCFKPAILIDGMLYLVNAAAFNRSKNGKMLYTLVKDDKTTTVVKFEDVVKSDNDNIKGENISSRGSELAKKLTNPGNNLEVIYKGKKFRNAEHAYQTWKSGEFDEVAYNSTDFKPKGVKPVNKATNYQTMVDILVAKFQQHPELVKEVIDAGGIEYLKKCTHHVTGDVFWEKEGNFIKALVEAAERINLGKEITTKEVPVTPEQSSTSDSSSNVEGEDIIDLDILSEGQMEDRIIEKCRDAFGNTDNTTIALLNKFKKEDNYKDRLINTIISLYKGSDVKCKYNGKIIC